MSFEVTVTPTVYDVEVEVNPSVQPFDVEVITNQDLADLVDEAKQYAEDAEDSADSASASASSASASALASANSASSASASASSASGSASTATTQAGIATSQAGIATTQAGIATTKANEASQSASNALASEQASAQSASDALASEQASAQSASDALASEQASALSASDALASEQASALSEANALASEQSALSSAQSALASASSASQSAQDAQNAVDSLVFGNLTEATSSVLTIAGGTGAVFGTGTTIQVKQASGSQSGFLSSTDWSTFNNKQNTITNPVTGTGASGQVGFWTGTGTQSGDSGFTFSESSNVLTLGISNSENGSLRIFRNGAGSAAFQINSLNGYIIGGGNIVVWEPFNYSTASHNFNIGHPSVGDYNWYAGNNTTITNNTFLMRLTRTGNLLLNTTTDAGFRLDVNGTARVQGALSVTTGADVTPLTISGYSLTGANAQSALSITGTWNTTGTPEVFVLNITNTASGSNSRLVNISADSVSRFRIFANGDIYIGPTIFRPIGSSGSPDPQSGNFGIFTQSTTATPSTLASLFFSSPSVTLTSGTFEFNGVRLQFAPTSGTAVGNSLVIKSTINQTGGASGITRGLFVNPTLTSAADWRSIEWSNNTGWGLYGVGSANNYLLGSLGIGSTSLSGYNLRISKNMTGASSYQSVAALSSILNDVTSTARYYVSSASQASGGTLILLQHYYAAQGAISGTVTNQHGFSVANSLTDATNNYGFYGDIPSGTGRWNIYMAGTASNYLRGNLLLNTTTDAGFLLDVNGTARFSNDVTIADTRNIILATGTGTKIGTATSQKLGFWNATPIVQPTTAVAGATRVGGGGTTLTDTDTFDGYTLAQIVKALRNMGALA